MTEWGGFFPLVPAIISHGSEGPEACFQWRHEAEVQQRELAVEGPTYMSQAHPRYTLFETPFVSHTAAEVTSSWLTSACGFKCHQIHPYASCLLSSYLFEIWACWISLQHESLWPVICLCWISLIELFSRKNKRLWWPMWNPTRKVYGCQHNTMNISLPPTRTEDALVLRRDEFFSLQHTDEKRMHLCYRLHTFQQENPPREVRGH